MKSRSLPLVAVALVAALAGSVAVGGYQVRQYYSGWQKHPTAGYAYRTYYYKPTEDYSGYKHHYVVYTPKDPNHYYYYNPYKKQYWGRCPSQCGGKPLYSMLAEQDRRPTIGEIPPNAFPKPSAAPSIPESTDKTQLDVAPDEPPAGATAAPSDLPPGNNIPSNVAPVAPTSPAAPAAPPAAPAAPQ